MRNTLTVAIIFVCLKTAIAEFSLVPLINEAVVGESTFFDCTSTTHINEVQWYHYRVGAKDHEDICLCCMGKTHPQYVNRIEVLHNSSNYTYRLKIKSVQLEDAGGYICNENGGIGDSPLAELVVLASAPTCHTNMKPDGLLGPNSCNIEPNSLHISCNVSYQGNISPMLQWREIRSLNNSINKGPYCRQTGFAVTCVVALKASFDLHGSSYVCETTASSTKRYNCSAGVVRVIHTNSNNSVSRLVYGTNQTAICLANSSQSCSYTWKWVQEGHEEVVVSNSAALIPSKPGWYRCEAECSIRGEQCTVLSRQIMVSEKTDTCICLSEVGEQLINILELMVAVALILLVALLICFTNWVLSKTPNSRVQKKSIKSTSQAERLPALELMPLRRRNANVISNGSTVHHNNIESGILVEVLEDGGKRLSGTSSSGVKIGSRV